MAFFYVDKQTIKYYIYHINIDRVGHNFNGGKNMTNSQIATLLNNTIVPNLLGENQTIAEDLSNMVDLGIALNDPSITASQLADYTGSFVAAVAKTYFDERIFKKVVGGIFRDYTEWGGIIQRVKAGLSKVTDDVSQNLVNGVSYDPNVYVGFTPDNKIYTKDASFELDWSVPNNMWKSAFNSVEELGKLIAYIQNRAENTMNAHLYSLNLTTLRALAVTKAGSRIKALTEYNKTFGTSLTVAQAMHDADFLKWFAELVLNLKRAITDISTKYNDGTVETFTPEEDVIVTMLSPMATALDVNMESGVYHKELVDVGEYDTINYWQNSGDTIIPDMAQIGEIVSDIDGSGTPVTIENAVCLIHDKYQSCGITAHEEVLTAQFNAKGNFTNYFRRIWAQYFVCTNMSAILITLE